MDRLLAGAAGGLLATVPMTAIMTMLFQKLPVDEQYALPPREITEDIVKRLPLEQRHRPPLVPASLMAHFAYGAATGALYPLWFKRAGHPIIGGSSFGLAVWATSYLGWIPAANILLPATAHPRRRNGLMIAAHLVWGTCTAVIAQRLSRSLGAPSSYGDE